MEVIPDGPNGEILPERVIVVVAFDATGFDSFQGILDQIKETFNEQSGVKVYGAVQEMAAEIISTLEGE